MSQATVDGVSLSYELFGDGGRPWAITPGGRFGKDYGGVRELGQALAERGNRVVIWDRPNCGASDVCFEGESESAMQADALAGLLRHLDLGPTVIVGGSGGSRVSMLTAARHPDLAAALGIWWISGGEYGLMSLGVHYCGESVRVAWNGGMEAVADLPEWQEVIERNAGNRQRFLDQDPVTFAATMKRWMLVYCPCGDDVVPGLPEDMAAAMTLPTIVFRSGASDMHHPRPTSEAIAAALPNARLVEPPWPDTEWVDRQVATATGEGTLFSRWHLLAPQLTAWADEVLA